MKKYFLFPLIIFSFVSIGFAGLSKVYAANLDIYCDDVEDGDQCDKVGSPTLFNESNWYPGSTATKTISVVNGDHNDDCKLKAYITNLIQAPVGFASQLYTAVKKNGTLIYGGLDGSGNATDSRTLQTLFDGGAADFRTVPQNNGTANYEWILTFNKDADDTFVNASATFSFNVDFACNHAGDTYEAGSHNDNNSGGSVAGTATGEAVTNFFGNIFAGVAGAETVAEVIPAGEEAPEVNGALATTPATEGVKGASICVDPKFWWILFIVQFLLGYLFYRWVNKQNVDKKKRHFLIQILTDLVFMFVFWKYFCPWWDVLVSALIGVSWLTLLKRKIDRLEKQP